MVYDWDTTAKCFQAWHSAHDAEPAFTAHRIVGNGPWELRGGAGVGGILLAGPGYEPKENNMDPKQWYESKTVWMNLAALLLAATSLTEFTRMLSDGALPYVLAGQSVLNIILRWVTDRPIE